MSIKGIRSIRKQLQEEMDYAPPDDAHDSAWDHAVLRAEKAHDRYERMGHTFALLDAIDNLSARLKRMERRFDNWIQTHPSNEDFDITERGG